MHQIAIIAAGGTGSRLRADLPKQFIEIEGKPIIIHTLEKFIHSGIPFSQIIIVGHPDYRNLLDELLVKWFPQNHFTVCNGGATRFHSIHAGLSCIKPNAGIVGIHDAARPCLSLDMLRHAFQAAALNGCFIPFTNMKESLRVKQNATYATVDRAQYISIQTPQIFDLDLLKKAYTARYLETFTDDATVFEHAGNTLHFEPGEDTNIKITTAIDLAVAHILLHKKSTSATH